MEQKHFLKLLDFTPAEITHFLDVAADLKAKKKQGIQHACCPGKHVALIFEKTSTRTRCAFEVAARDLGMGVTYLDPSGSQIGKKESIADTARVLGRFAPRLAQCAGCFAAVLPGQCGGDFRLQHLQVELRAAGSFPV